MILSIILNDCDNGYNIMYNTDDKYWKIDTDYYTLIDKMKNDSIFDECIQITNCAIENIFTKKVDITCGFEFDYFGDTVYNEFLPTTFMDINRIKSRKKILLYMENNKIRNIDFYKLDNADLVDIGVHYQERKKLLNLFKNLN